MEQRARDAKESTLKTNTLGIKTVRIMSNHIEDKDDKMTITVKRGEETISFETSPDLHISEFRDLLMRLTAAVGYQESNIEQYFLPKEERDTQFANEATVQSFQKEACSTQDMDVIHNDILAKNYKSFTHKETPSVDMGGNYTRDDTFV